MTRSKTILIALVVFLTCSAHANAQSKFEVGLRANVLLGDGQPSNDILGAGLIGKILSKRRLVRGRDAGQL